jgi:tripartite-type tricarboxylate transporter receptor subunit TctC
MKFRRRELLRLGGAAAIGVALPRAASASDYPNRPVRVLVGYPAGGAADTAARLIAQRLSQRRSEEHTSQLQSRSTISYAVFCLKKKKNTTHQK